MREKLYKLGKIEGITLRDKNKNDLVNFKEERVSEPIRCGCLTLPPDAIVFLSNLKNLKSTIAGNTIRNVIYNNPATIVKWRDGTKTVVKCQDGDTYNPETGLAMCIIKKLYGNKGRYNDIFKKWLPKKEKQIAEFL